MLLGGYIKLARSAMRASRWRSLLTMLGIIVGIVSVVTTVSIGEGVKRQIIDQINFRGEDLITILPGESSTKNANAYFSRFNPTDNRATAVFGEPDYQAVIKTESLSFVTPFSQVSGVVAQRETKHNSFRVIATTESLPEIINKQLEFGTFFKNDDKTLTNSAVIGRQVAEDMFGENSPLGRDFTIRDTRFIVRGVFEEFQDTSPLLSLQDFDDVIFIPHRIGQELTGGNLQIYQILARAKEGPEATSKAIVNATAALKKARGADDFSVLQQSETLSLAEDTLALMTSMIAGVAAISLIVGGIGIMNIMLVSVTERTREIGVRKAVGATNRQIMYQFITEAAVLSFMGGVLGIIFSLATNFVLRVTTELGPIITLPIMGIAVGAAFVIGVVFGAAPALVAARKDPIESLRYQ
jgi:putative ABC transport system permease protein